MPELNPARASGCPGPALPHALSRREEDARVGRGAWGRSEEQGWWQLKPAFELVYSLHSEIHFGCPSVDQTPGMWRGSCHHQDTEGAEKPLALRSRGQRLPGPPPQVLPPAATSDVAPTGWCPRDGAVQPLHPASFTSDGTAARALV